MIDAGGSVIDPFGDEANQGPGQSPSASGVDDPNATRVQGFRQTGQVGEADRQELIRRLGGGSPLEPSDPVVPPLDIDDLDVDLNTSPEPGLAMTSAPSLSAVAMDDEGLAREHPGRFHEIGELGKGGMGLVLAAHDRGLMRDVALKILQPELRDRQEFVAALRREAQILGSLEHPSILPIYELGLRPDGQTYYTMRRMTGRTLGDVLRTLQLGDPAAAREWVLRRLVQVFIHIAQGMTHAHARGIVHRDLKPDNVLLGELGEVQICDWGVAKRLDRDPLDNGVVIGTPTYMAPEQASGRDSEVDARADIYALGVMFYEIMTLRRPYGGENSQQQLEACQNVVPLPPSAVARDRLVPPDLELLCMRMLEKKRERRPQTMREVYEALEAFLAGDLQRQRLLERAEQSYQRALEVLTQAEALRAEREFVMQELEALQREVRPWHPQAKKQHALVVRQHADLLDVLYSQEFSTAVEQLRQAIDQGEGHPAARQRLIELYWQRHDEAAQEGDNATKLYFARQAHELEGLGQRGPDATQRKGVVHIRSQPQGALIYAVPFDEVRDNLEKPAAQYELGHAPIVGAELPVGPYMLLARLDGHRDALATVYLREYNRDILMLCHPWSSDLPRTGREVELRRLWQLLDDAEVLAEPRVCLVSGELGMGKNALLDAFRGQVERHPTKLYFLMEVACSKMRRDLPYAAVVALVRLRAGILDHDNADQTRAKVRRMVSYAFARLGRRTLTPERQAEADRVADVISSLPAFDIIEPERMGTKQMQSDGHQPFAEALAAYFQAVAVTTPVLLLIRNAQNMDPCSLGFFRQLFSTLQGAPILTVASTTEGDDVATHPGPIGRHGVPHQLALHVDEHLHLGALSDAAVQTLAREMLGAPADRELMAWVQQNALGNPFLAGELVQLMARRGAMQLENGQWQLVERGLSHEVRPGDVRTVIALLIDTLPAHAREALSMAVAIGGEFWAGALRHLGVRHLDDALDLLVQHGFVVRNASSRYPRDREYRLASTLRWRVAYDLLDVQRRRELHRKIASWIASQGRTDLEEGLLLAHHLRLGGQSEEAALLYTRIAKAAQGIGADEEAERLWTSAYVLTSSPELQAAVEQSLWRLQVTPRRPG